MLYYFFSGASYIAVERTDAGHGAILPGYPRPISDWGWGTFGHAGIDAALYSGSKCYFFKGSQYIRVTRGATDFGKVDPGFPRPISDWKWPVGFGASGIDAAMWSGAVCYFFKGSQYIRVHRDDTSFGTVDPGYPKSIGASWALGSFAAGGIHAALYSDAKVYMFAGTHYVQISEADLEDTLNDVLNVAADTISAWGWGAFGSTGIDAALNSPGPLAPVLSTGAKSQFNYVVHAGGDNLTGVTVTIAFDEFAKVIPHPPNNTDQGGWAIQMNCYSPSKAGVKTLWQQYIIESPPGTGDLAGHINNFTAPNNNSSSIPINGWLSLLNGLPPDTLKEGTFLSISPQTDAADNVIGCVFTITYESDRTGQSFVPGLIAPKTASIYMNMLSHADWPNHGNLGANITPDYFAPIVAFELNIVGHLDGSPTTFTSGAGTISYTAAQRLTVSDGEPSFVHFGGKYQGTAETSNIAYGRMPVGYTSCPTQSFRAAV
jgi:Hemopexin